MKIKDDNLVQSVDRALVILETLAEEKKGMGVTRIARETGLNKTTVHRLLATLMNRGYIEKEIEGDNYKLGNKLLYLAGSILDRMDVRNISIPYLRKLSKQVGQVVHLAVLDGNMAVYIDKVESENTEYTFKMNSKIGKRIPIYCTAVGKVLVSYMNDTELERVFNESEVVKFTDNTITTIDDFKSEIKKVKQEKVGYDNVENEEGIRCIAAPIYNRDGKIVAAFSVSGLSMFMTDEKMEELKEKLLETSKVISYQLGFI